MVQQINLYGPAFRRLRSALTLGRALQLAGLAAVALAVVGTWLARVEATDTQAGQAAADRDRSTQQARIAELKLQLQERRRSADTELNRLRGVEQALSRVQLALQRDTGGPNPARYVDYFHALARHTHAALWITGFAVSADGRALELKGRMLDASALPDYLARLNAEPVFKGRRFEQLSVTTVPRETGGGNTDAPALTTEFVLRTAGAPADTREAAR